MKQEKNIWEQSRVELFQKLDCRETGLSQEDAADRLAKYGANELHAGKQKSVLQIFLGQFADFLVLILILAAVISACMGDVESMIVILAVITMNAILGTVQTVKASASLDSLKQMSAPTAKVLRDGQIVQIPGREVVPGDVVILEAGDSVCADGRLLECASLKCVESALTGESLPVPEGAYSCIVCGDALVFNCYARPADLAADEWDDDPSLHSWVTVQQKDGTQTYGSSTSTASRISYEPDELDNWVELDISHADGSPVDQVLHNPATGEGLRGYRQTCGHGTAAFLTPSGTYQLRDLTTEDRGVIAEFDALPSNYFPGYVVTWNVDSDYRYSLHDLSTGEVTPLYAVSLAGNRIALYAQDGSLKVCDTDTGALLTDVNAGAIGDDQRVTLDCEEDGFVWMELRDADSYEIAAIRVYGPEGLVSDLSSLNETYNYLGYLTTDANGRPLYYGTRSVPGSSYATGCDVLNETGNVVMQGLGSCYSYYDNSLNQLPEHVFVAKRGFYYGWMDTDGKWLYCQSIFSSINADDEMGY